MSMFIGEALAGEGNEIAHIDLLIGDKDGPVGIAFANALARQSEGHSNLLAVLTPNLLAKPATVMITKVTIKGMRAGGADVRPGAGGGGQGGGRLGGRRRDLARSRPKILCASAACSSTRKRRTTSKIYDYNYQATKEAIKNAMAGKPTIDEILAGKDKAAHPFRGSKVVRSRESGVNGSADCNFNSRLRL